MSSRRGRRWYVPVAAILALAVGVLCAQETGAADLAATDANRAGLGVSNETAIEVCGPSGEHAYFDRLICPDGSLVNYERIGNEGYRNSPASKADQEVLRLQMLTSAPIQIGQRDFHMIGGYSVECAAGKTTLYVDRYHCPDPKDQGAPPGFSFVKDKAPRSAQTQVGQRGLGLAKATAIEVCGPQGERDYLDRLKCPDGSVVRSMRTGSMGLRNDPTSTPEDEAARQQFTTAGPIPAGQKDFHLIDGYSAECHAQKTFLYIDPNHCPDPKSQNPPPGFSIDAGVKAR